MTLPRLLLVPAALSAMACTRADTGGWSAEVGALVDDLVEAHPKGPSNGRRPAVVFDFDQTMILGDLGFAAVAYQVRHLRYGFDPAVAGTAFPPEVARLFATVEPAPSLPPARSALEAAVLSRYDTIRSTQGVDAALSWLAAGLEGLTVEEARQLGRDVLAAGQAEPVCSRTWTGPDGTPTTWPSGIRVREPVRWMVDRLDAAGFEVWIVSASPEPLVEGAAEVYGIPPERVVGVRSAEAGGRLTAQVLPPLPYRQGKVEALKATLAARPALVFGDAWSDYEILTWADKGILLDRGQADLADAARKAFLTIQPPFEGEPDPRAACPG